MRWACAVAGVAMVVSGCSCPPPPVVGDCTDTTISFETPTADQTVDSPFDVSVIVKAANGNAFAIDGATLSVGGGSFTATVSGNRATFTGVTASAGAQTLTATIAQGSCSKSSSPQNIVVRDACSNAAVTMVSFPQDIGAGPLGVLNRNELPPGTNLQVKVDAACVAGVQVRIKRGNTEVSPLTAFTNGSATITLPTLPDADSARYELFAELVRGTTVVNTLASNPAAGGTIQVERALPSCAVTMPTSCFGPMDDADSVAAGFQLRVTGTMATTSSGSFTLGSQPAVTVTPSMTGDVSADFTLTASGSYVATLSCTDGNGNTNTAMGTYCADFQPPTVTITSPASVDGGATMVLTQSPLVITVSTDAEDGSLAEVFRNGVSVGTGVVAAGMVSLSVPFGADGDFAVTVNVTDLAGNVGTAAINVSVSLSGCGAIFTRPGACPALLTQAQMPSGTYSFQTSSKTLCANQPAALFRADVLSDGGVTAEVSVGATTLTGSGLASFSPLTVASGDYLFRSEVTNIGPDAGVSTVSCQVTVDLDGPAITSPIVPMASPYATINAAQDTQTGTPGVQRVLTFSARVPVGGRIDVCTTQPVNPNAPLTDGGFATRPTSPECGSGWYVLQQGVTSPANGFTFPDGSYEVKIVVVGGGLAVAPASAPVAVLVDSVRPCVNGITRDLPQDTNNDDRLSIAELGGAQPQLVFGLGCGDTSVATLAATSPVVVRDIVGGVAAGVRPSTAVFAAGQYTVTLTGTYATEVDLNLFVELTDIAGNRNQLAAMNDPATWIDLRIDPVAPVCSITSPSAPLLGIAQVPGGNLDVLVATSADVGTGGVNLTFTGQTARVLTPTLSQAQSTYSLTGDNTYTIGATCTDQSGNPSNATAVTTRVDLVAPTCNITSPANPAVSSANDVTTTVAVTGVSAGTVTIASSLAGITNNLLTVSGAAATGLVRYPNGVQTVTASINDVAGNPCVAPTGGTRTIQLTVNSTSCNLDFAAASTVITNANGSWVNRASASNPTGASPTTIAVGAVTSDCGAGKNVYLYQGPPVPTPGGTPQVTSAGGTVSFAGTMVSEGQQWTVTIDNGAGVLTHRSFIVSFAAPSIASIGLQRSAAVPTVVPVAANAGIIFGAASGNRRVETAVATDMVFSDLDGAMADAQFQLTLTGVDGARVGTLNAELDVFEGTTALMPTVSVTTAAFNPSLPRMKLNHRVDDTATTLVIRVTSPAGNVFTSAHSSEVDVIAPAAPVVAQNLTAARAATVGLSWMPVFDDGASIASGGLTGGTPAAGYDVRWTTSSVPLNNLMAAESDYFGSASKQDGITAWSASAIVKPLALPPINTYFIAVRARDEVGNYSTFAAPAALPNQWVTSVITAAVASSGFGTSVLTAPLIGNDVAGDLVVTAQTRGGVGSVYVYPNALLAASQAGCPTGCQELVPSDLVAGAFGSDVSVGNVGAVGAEARPDLVVGQTWTASGNAGRAVLFFGTTAPTFTVADSIEFRGETTIRIGSTVQIIRDITGDGRDEIAIAAPLFSANRGRIFIYRGRDRADWLTIRTSTDGTTLVPFIPVNTTTADYVIDGPLPLLVSPAGNAFGQNRRGLISINDLDGDTFPDVALPTSRASINRYRVFGSATIKTSSGAAPLDSSSAFRLEISESTIADNSSLSGLGAVAMGNADLFGSSPSADLVLSYPGLGGGGQLLLFSALAAPTTPTLNPTVTQRITGPLTFGSSLAAATVDGDSTTDILAATSLISGNTAWLVYQSTAQFESGPLGGAGVFWVTRFDATTITGNANSRLGAASVLADVSGDSLNDVILGDSQIGEVRLWK